LSGNPEAPYLFKGSWIPDYAAVACVISFLITGHRSVYPSQVLAITKSSSFTGENKGREMKDIEDVDVEIREKSVTGGIIKGLEKMKKDKEQR